MSWCSLNGSSCSLTSQRHVCLVLPATAGTSGLVLGPITGSYALDDVAHTRFEGTDADDQTGVAVSTAGDVDADGLADILIGAPGDDTYGDNAGAAYLILAAGL